LVYLFFSYSCHSRTTKENKERCWIR